MLPTSRLIQEESANCVAATDDRRIPPGAPPTLPSIIVDDVHGNDDDPPPYSAVVPPNHIGWSWDFSRIPYSVCSPASACTPEATPLAGFQTGLTSSGAGSHAEGIDGQSTSISMPCRLFMFGSRRSLFAHGGLPFSDNNSVCKDAHANPRKYGGILIGAAVIIFLMALSLLVRFVMDKNLWRG